MALALDDVRVLEFGQGISVPYCGKLFADLGAEVTKIEPVTGDSCRRRGPFLDDVPGRERSGLFLYLNANKRSITLDPEKPTGREIFLKLIKDVDILLEDTVPGTFSTLGLAYDTLREINPALVMTSVTPFGQTGPYKDYKGADLIAWNIGGLGYITPVGTGTPEKEPLRMMQMASFLAGSNAASAAMVALHFQRTTGEGQQVDVSQMEAIFDCLGYYYWPYEKRSPTRVTRLATAPIGFLSCKDGWVFIVAIEDHHWQGVLEMMDNPEWGKDERFKDRFTRANNWGILEPLMLRWFQQHDRAEIIQIAKERKIPLGSVNDIGEICAADQLKSRNYFQSWEHPVCGKLTYPGAPYKFAVTPWSVRRPAPLLGQHNEEIYCGTLGYRREELVALYETGII
ncbi:MAG: CoA transferase [Dehalococcoidales bacterium]|nr:CoA transferase [Dehalococcoidales bacterium]